MGHLEIGMKSTANITLFVCLLAWCTSGWCEEKKIDPGVINDWMRATVSSDSDNSELKRVVYSSTTTSWMSSQTFYHVRYEVENSSCKRTLTFNFTDFHGNSYHPDWVKSIKEDQERDLDQLQKPKVLVRVYENEQPRDERPIMDLEVEYQVIDGMPVVVVLDQREVMRTLREFKTGDFARIHLGAFETSVNFELDLQGFAGKEGWSNEHCPLEETESSTKETPAS